MLEKHYAHVEIQLILWVSTLNQQQKDFNSAMRFVCEAVEWGFGKVLNYFAFADFKKNMKIELRAVGKTYVAAELNF